MRAVQQALLSYGGMPDQHVRRSMQLFAREVMSALERSTVYA